MKVELLTDDGTEKIVIMPHGRQWRVHYAIAIECAWRREMLPSGEWYTIFDSLESAFAEATMWMRDYIDG